MYCVVKYYLDCVLTDYLNKFAKAEQERLEAEKLAQQEKEKEQEKATENDTIITVSPPQLSDVNIG